MVIILKAVLIDSNKKDMEDLFHILKHYRCIDVIGIYTDPDKAFEEILKKKADIVFSEIYLTNFNGLGLIRKIHRFDSSIDIIFVSCNDTYGVEAFQLNVLDYVLKPVTQKRIALTMKKINKKRM